MRMNIECIRDILLQTEIDCFAVSYNPETPYSCALYIEDNIENHLAKYDLKTLFYHVNLAYKSNLIEVIPGFNTIAVNDLTFEGHLLLDKIRDTSVWNKIIKLSKTVGITSINVLVDIATNILTEKIKDILK